MPKRVKIILFGAGLLGRETFSKVGAHVDVIAFSDNDPNKHGMNIYGVPVIPPREIHHMEYDNVVIAATAVSEIYTQLKLEGVPEEKIIILSGGEESKPVFPWDAILFLFIIVAASLTILVYLFI